MQKCTIEKNDFVRIFFSSKQVFKYGLVHKVSSPHTVEVKLLVRRNMDGGGTVGIQTFDSKNLTILHVPKNDA